jgi:DNA segregation ATPase FtsK/SpoIIIE-like protein
VTEPRIVLFVDELADLIEAGGPEVLAAVTRLTQRGRSAGIHVVACTQKPTASAIGSLVKSNFPVRLVGSVGSPEDAKVAAGLAGTGAERLLGSGDFLLVVKGRVTRFQAAYTDARTVRAVVARLATEKRQSRRWVTDTPLAETPPQLGERPQAASRWVPKIVVDNRDRIERDARKVLAVDGWAETWIEDGKFRYRHQSEIGRIIDQDNAGAGRKRILEVAEKVMEIYTSSTSSTASELSDPAENAKTRVRRR